MVDVNRLVKKIQERIESGVAFMIGAYGNEYVSERLARKYLGEWSELATGLGGAIALDIIGLTKSVTGYERYVDKVVDGLSDYGMAKTVMHYKLLKRPIAYFKDANTIIVKNMDIDEISTATVKVYVDDVQYNVSAVEGETGSFTVSLASAVDKGWHKLLIVAGNQKKDAIRRKAYVP